MEICHKRVGELFFLLDRIYESLMLRYLTFTTYHIECCVLMYSLNVYFFWHIYICVRVAACRAYEYQHIMYYYNAVLHSLRKYRLMYRVSIRNFDKVTVSIRKFKRFARNIHIQNTFFLSEFFSRSFKKIKTYFQEKHKFTIIISTRMHSVCVYHRTPSPFFTCTHPFQSTHWALGCINTD